MSEYTYYYGLKVRIYPSTEQKQVISVNSDVNRFVYNKMVQLGKEISSFGKPNIHIKVVDERLTYLKELKKSTTMLKNMYPWLCDKRVDSLAIANAKQNYNKAWNLYRKVYNIAPPNYHKKNYIEKYQTNGQYNKKKIETPTICNGTCRFSKKHVILPCLGKIRYKGSTKVMQKLFHMQEIRIGTITITRDTCGDYYASFLLASDIPFVEKLPKTGAKVGIDLNVENFYADSNGNFVDNPKYYRKARKRLAKAQRKLGKRKKKKKKEGRSLEASSNYQKQRLLVAKMMKEIMNRRKNFLHNQSMALINNHDLVVAEELRSKNMMKNHALAMSIQDNGWRTFLSMLAYKAELYDKEFITVNPKNTTQTCNKCGHIMKGEEKLTLNIREWVCPICGSYHIRDVNAAINILNKGLST